MNPSSSDPSDLPTAIQWLFDHIVNLIPNFVDFLRHLIGALTGLCLVLSLIFFIGIVYCVEQLKKIRIREKELYELKVDTGYETVDKGDAALSTRWETVQKHITSTNENDWKQAIIESDIILDEILTKMGYHGESVGEKLKRVEPADFNSLDDAWEAHKVRNRIAHDGSSFAIGQHEAQTVINLYKKVFEEFYYI
jgi:hypothetical protein